MSRHKDFSKLTLSSCECGDNSPHYLSDLCAFDVTFEADKVVYECEKCGEMVALFYREPEIEKNPVKLVGVACTDYLVSVPRVVAWVGYAKNTNTVQISIEREETEAKRVLHGALANANIKVTEDQVERFLHRYTTPSGMVSGLHKHVRWHIYKEAFATNPSPRGLWFQDVPFAGVVQEIVVAKTGTYSSGGQYGGEWDPPYLSCTGTHRLYGCIDDYGQKALVWPGDVRE